jgi:hypothetical protein
MNVMASRNEQMFGAWSGIIYALLLVLGWWLVAGFVPPPKPSAGAEEIAKLFQDHTMNIRIGMIIIMFGAMFYMPWTAVLAQQISRIEGRIGMLTWCQVMAGTCNVLLTFYPPLLWLIISFRPERPVQLTYLLNDAAWLLFVGGLTPLLPAVIAIGAASFRKQKEPAIFPRWLGYFNFWCLLLFLPGQLMFFFKTGPFAWNGLLAFWLPISAFAVWFVVIFLVLKKAIYREAESPTAQGFN